MKSTIIFRRVALGLLLALPMVANAATYYVDSVTGNDAWSGMLATGGGTDGPWRSIGKVNQTRLYPGDVVLFKCGQVWNETLAPLNSGETGLPIRFGSLPYGCTNRPKISGFNQIFADAWVQRADGSWKASLPANMVRNGALTSSIAYWRVWSSDGLSRLWLPSRCIASTERCLAAIASAGSTLVTSPSFPVIAGQQYRLRVSARGEPRASIGFVVRQDGGAYSPLGLTQKVTADGSWRDYEYTFTANRSETAARFDLEAAPGVTTYIRNVSVVPVAAAVVPEFLVDGALPLEPAHHPNRGHDVAKPTSVFLPTSAVSPAFTDGNARRVSNSVAIGTPALPAGAAVVPGLGIHVRNNMWSMSHHKIASVSADGRTVVLDSNTLYPLAAIGLGYYLTGAPWMLDSAGEWFYDSAAGTLSVRPWSGGAPGDAIRYGALAAGINAKARSHLQFEDIAVDGAIEGLQAGNSTGLVFRRVSISNVRGDAVGAMASNGLVLDSLKINATGGEAVLGWDSVGLQVLNSEMTNIGIVRVDGKRYSLPRHMTAALTLARGAIVRGNRIAGAGYSGISSGENSTIEANVISDVCLTLNDCGGVILDAGGSNTTITNNLIVRGEGNTDGLPAAYYSHSVGLYLDNFANGVRAIGNRVADFDFGVQVHDSNGLTFQGNTIFGNRRYQIWLQETNTKTRAAGDVHSNQLIGNNIFPTLRSAVVKSGSVVNADLTDLASYSSNRYAMMFTDWAVGEYYGSASNYYSLEQWQALSTNTGASRGNDAGSTVAAPLQGYAIGPVSSTSILPNGGFANNAAGWVRWNGGGTASSMGLDTCTGSSSACLRVFSGGSVAGLASSSFAVTKDRYYRYTFDVFSSQSNVSIKSMVRRAGTPNYNSLDPQSRSHSLGQEWRRFTVIFKSADSAPMSGSDNGARLDFLEIPANVTLWFRNVELMPIDADVNLQSGAMFVANESISTSSFNCPDLGTSLQYRCISYQRFPEGTTVSWPLSLAAGQATVVFVQDKRWPDSDRDGIPDSQDACPGTVVGEPVNARGCSISQAQ